MTTNLKILAIPGSIGEQSINKSVIRAMQKLQPEGMELEIFELDHIPMFNKDLESNLPQEIKDMIMKFEQADAVLISTPEYGNMIPGVLKNMTEWMSRRAYSAHAVKDKPIAITGASDGDAGTARAQNQLLLLALILGFDVDASLRMRIPFGDKMFNEEGELINEEYEEHFIEFMKKFKKSIESK